VVEDEVVDGYLILPLGKQACPVVIATNGLEGTVQELVLPLIRYRHSGLAVFVMEMPGTYSYHRPMSGASEKIYHRVIDHIADHPRVDANRIGFVGVSFGGYWAARMAAASQRLRCVVACGAPTHNSFLASSAIGIPDIIVRALLKTTQAGNFHRLGKQLQALSLREAYRQISTPLLVINGENDTLLSTKDSIELAAGARNATLVLYPGDDHCAMGHYREWLDMSQAWLQEHLHSQCL
jgi:esterase FrsA